MKVEAGQYWKHGPDDQVNTVWQVITVLDDDTCILKLLASAVYRKPTGSEMAVGSRRTYPIKILLNKGEEEWLSKYWSLVEEEDLPMVLLSVS